MQANNADANLPITRDHRRQWRDCLYVYPVISRRARGVSIGVNLSINKRCNYDCVYCQVDRQHNRPTCPIELPQLTQELREAIGAVLSGDLWRESRFTGTPDALRRINDIAFSGDGEPTASARFAEAIQAAAQVRQDLGLDDVKLIVITNATNLQSHHVADALPTLQSNNGEFWAKLDAGTEEHYQRVNRPLGGATLDIICDNILFVARQMPTVIQSLFFRSSGASPDDVEIDAYIARLRGILDGGGQIRLLQIHTVARTPAEAYVDYLPNDELDALAGKVRDALPDLAIEVTYGSATNPQ